MIAGPDDETIIREIRDEERGVPAASYLQRRYGLPYLRAALLRRRIAEELGAGEAELRDRP